MDNNTPIYTISALSQALKGLVEGAFGHVRLRGEIGRVSRPASGHVYLSLKDDKAVLDGVVWRGTGLGIAPEAGLEVICTGRMTTYAGQSKYQIVVETMEPAGKGALMALLEARRKALFAEGLFEAARKQPLPALPRTIGVVTSPSGAVIRDILHRLRARFPCHVLVWPVRVQGETSAGEVVRAIVGFNAMTPPRPDLLIVARGGGSLEDLWGFNDEDLVRAVAQSAIPLISAVGHETDRMLIDDAADKRAPTPSAAAEIAVPVRSELVADILSHAQRLIHALRKSFDARHAQISGLARGLARGEGALGFAAQRFDAIAGRLPHALRRWLDTRRERVARASAALSPKRLAYINAIHEKNLRLASERLAGACRQVLARREARVHEAAKLLAALSHERVLERGFALVRDAASGKHMRRAEDAHTGQALDITLARGDHVAARVASTRPRKDDTRPRRSQPKLF